MCFVILSFSIATIANRLHAQQPNSAMRVRIAQAPVENFMADLEHIIKLNKGANANQQWKNLEGLLDVFLVGIDRDKPIRWDLILGDGPVRFRPSFPVNKRKLREFRKQNLQPLGIKTVKRLKNLYVCRGVFPGFMHYQNNYATFVEKQSDLKGIDLKNVTARIAPLVSQYDLGMEAENILLDARAISTRRTWFEKNKKQILAAFQKNEKETKENFEYRKSLFELQLNEVEWYYSEVSNLKMGWITDAKKNEGRGELFLSAIPDSSLHKAIALLGEKNSFFANIPRNENSILSFRLNHPLDDVRKKQLQSIFQAFSDKATSNIDLETERTTEQKEAGKKVVEKIHNILAENAQAGIADAFIEAWINSSKKQTTLAGLRVADSKEIDGLLKLLPKTRKGRSVENNIEQIDGFRVHRIVIDKDNHATLLSLFNASEILIATRKNVVWVAAGENAMNVLKDSIKAVKETPDDKSLSKDVVFKLYVKIKPFLELRAKEQGKKGNVSLRTKALAAFIGADDVLKMELRKDDEQLKGNMRIGNATLRFVGQMIADATKKYLEE